jgi:hypothetical protein
MPLCSPKAAPTCTFNQMAFSQSRFCLQLPENRWMQLVACSGEPFYSQIGNRHTIIQISFDFSAGFQSTLSNRNATGLPKSAATRQFNHIAFSESRFCLQLPENRSMQLVACPGEPFYSYIGNRHTFTPGILFSPCVPNRQVMPSTQAGDRFVGCSEWHNGI